jgi:hypothetical protein
MSSSDEIAIGIDSTAPDPYSGREMNTDLRSLLLLM